MRWVEDGTVLVGPQALDRAGDLAQRSGGARALVVTDEGLADTPVVPALLQALDGFVAADVFSGVRPNPTVELIDLAGARAAEDSIDLVIALGGGSSLDAAKGIALVAANASMSAREFDFSAQSSDGAFEPALPILAIPTTAGTGSETNSWGVIDDPVAATKVYIGDVSTVPYATILDTVGDGRSSGTR